MILYLYELIYILPLAAASVFFAYFYCGAEPPGNSKIAAAVLISVLCVCLKRMGNKGRLILSGALAMLLAGVILVQNSGERAEFLYKNRWVVQILLVSLAAFAAGQLIMAFGRVRLGMSLVFAGVLCFTMVREDGISPVGVASLLFVLLLIYAEEIQQRWKKSGYTDGRKHLVYIAPFLFVGFLSVASLKAPQTPYDWNFVKVFWERTKDGFIELSDRLFFAEAEDFDSSLAGFSESGRMAGDVNENPKQIMEIVYNPGAGANIYLMGKVFDTFDGREWTANNVSDAEERTLDTLETLYAVTVYDGKYTEDYVRMVQFSINLLHFRTKYMFAPLKSREWAVASDKVSSFEQGGNLLFSKRMGNKASYTVRYYRMNEGHTVFEEFLDADHEENREIWDKVSEKRYSYEKLLAYRERVYEYYLPTTTVSERMQEQLREITADADSDFQKLKALEAYLQKLTYTDTPGVLSDRITDAGDYLDYFIFENPYGYCKYFSTAFVLMARALEIPARHVQGYRIPVEQTGRTTVTSDMAHAWPEAYIEGVGWIAFEPTPGYKQVTSWKTYAQKLEEQELAEKLSGTTAEKNEPAQIPEELKKEEEETVREIKWYRIAVPVAAVLLFLAAAAFCDLLLRRKRYRELDEDGKLRYLCNTNLRLLRLLGFSLNSGETLAEFEARAKEKLPREALEFIGCYERILYTPDSGNEAMRRQAEQAAERLLLLVREEKSVWFRLIVTSVKFTICI